MWTPSLVLALAVALCVAQEPFCIIGSLHFDPSHNSVPINDTFLGRVKLVAGASDFTQVSVARGLYGYNGLAKLVSVNQLVVTNNVGPYAKDEELIASVFDVSTGDITEAIVFDSDLVQSDFADVENIIVLPGGVWCATLVTGSSFGYQSIVCNGTGKFKPLAVTPTLMFGGFVLAAGEGNELSILYINATTSSSDPQAVGAILTVDAKTGKLISTGLLDNVPEVAPHANAAYMQLNTSTDSAQILSISYYAASTSSSTPNGGGISTIRLFNVSSYKKSGNGEEIGKPFHLAVGQVVVDAMNDGTQWYLLIVNVEQTEFSVGVLTNDGVSLEMFGPFQDPVWSSYATDSLSPRMLWCSAQ